MKFWQACSFTETEQLVDIAKIAEDVGFHGVFVSDHLYFPEKLESSYPYAPDGTPAFTPETPFPDVVAVTAAMAAVTTKLKFSQGVFILPLRHPFEVAKAAATLAILSGNRFTLGIGAGWMKEEFDQLGVEFRSRGKRMNEMIEVMRALWEGGMVEYHGDIFDFDRLQMTPAPSEPIPIYVGGVSKAALRRAARLGDGWFGPGNDPADVPDLMKKIHELRKEAGRDHLPFETIVPLTAPPEPDMLARLEDAGVTSTVSYPFSYTVGPSSTIDQKRAYLEGFAEAFIQR